MKTIIAILVLLISVPLMAGEREEFLARLDSSITKARMETAGNCPIAPEGLTPYPAIARMLQLTSPNGKRFVDFGSGPDARVVIEAAKYFNCRGIGIEIDSERVDMSRLYVKNMEYAEPKIEGMIKIIQGDATKVDVDADVGFAYLYPDTLKELKPQIEKLEMFVSYQHPVPGLKMSKHGDLYLWKRSRQKIKVETVTVEKPSTVQRSSNLVKYGGRLYNPQTYRGCSSGSCSMCRYIRSFR